MPASQELAEVQSALLSLDMRPTLLVILGSYLPGYKSGGPIRSIANLVSALGQEVTFRIVTLDRDLGEHSPFPGIVANRWVRVGHADVMYLRPGILGLLRICRLLRSIDRNSGLYLNSFFARRASMLPVLMRWLGLCRPRSVIIAPRGEFSAGALRIKSVRKRLFIRLAKSLGLYQGLIWHASSEFEAVDISRQFSLSRSVRVASVIPSADGHAGKKRRSQVAIASDLASAVPSSQRQRPPKVPGRLHIVFVSRLSRMKNLAGALKMVAGISGQVSLDLYGPLEDAAYWAECRDLISALPENIQVRYLGQIAHEEIGLAFATHELFLLPTFGENFGHVIAEALLAGCPVLISDQTPWRGLEALGVGWDLPLTASARFREVLQHCVDMGPEEHAVMCARATEFAERRANDPNVIEENRALFQYALGLGSGLISGPKVV